MDWVKRRGKGRCISKPAHFVTFAGFALECAQAICNILVRHASNISGAVGDMGIRKKTAGIVIGASVLTPAVSSFGAVIFDNSATQGNATHQVPGVSGADNGPGATITVSAPRVITNIGMETYQAAGGDLKFFVYDETTGTFPVITAPATFGTDYFSYAVSPSFLYTLLPTDTYDIGAISDADTYYAYGYQNDGNGTATYTQNGFTAPIRNILVTNYNSPTVLTGSGPGTVANPGSAQLALELLGPALPVPEPSTLALSSLAGVALLKRARRR